MKKLSVNHVVEHARAYRRDEAFGRQPVALELTRLSERAYRLRAHYSGATTVEITLPSDKSESICGLGEQFSQVDKRGRIIDGWLSQTVNAAAPHTMGLDGGYKLAPIWYSSLGYAAFSPTSLRFRLDLGVTDGQETMLRVPGDELELVVIDGPPREAVTELTAHIGRAPLAPPWVYGVWRSSRGGHDAVLDDARRTREAGIPVSAMWLDAHYQESSNSGFPAAGSYPLGEYPDIAKTVAGLHDLGYAALSYVNPYVYTDTPAAAEAEKAGALVVDDQGEVIRAPMLHPFDGDAFGILDEVGVHSRVDAISWVDLTGTPGREWFKDNLRRVLVDEGFDGWMEDFGEGVPENGAFADGTRAAETHNRWPLLYRQVTAAAIAEHKPAAAGFARGYWTGAQAHAKCFWPGDQARDWSVEVGLGSVVAAGVSFGLMGVAAWGPDIAANVGYPAISPFGQGSADEELYQRWCELGAMTPVMREHLGFFTPKPVDVWTSEASVATWRRCATWHIRHFPYLYTLAHETSRVGVPVLRGLMVEFPDDPLAWTVPQQFMLGEALLCAPVVTPGVRSRQVYLPAGDWVSTADGSALSGGEWHEVLADLESLPVLQRAGTVVPLLAETPAHLGDPRFDSGDVDLELRVTPGAFTRTLYDGTVVSREGSTVTVTSPVARRVVLADATGCPLAEGSGVELTLNV